MKIETPSNIDAIFDLGCFKFLDMKELFKKIFGHLHNLGNASISLNERMGQLPNPDDISLIFKKIDALEKQV